VQEANTAVSTPGQSAAVTGRWALLEPLTGLQKPWNAALHMTLPPLVLLFDLCPTLTL
jgi:hypothetical protein